MHASDSASLHSGVESSHRRQYFMVDLLCLQPEPFPKLVAARRAQFTLGHPYSLSARTRNVSLSADADVKQYSTLHPVKQQGCPQNA